MPSSYPIRRWNKTNHDVVTCIFPRLRHLLSCTTSCQVATRSGCFHLFFWFVEVNTLVLISRHSVEMIPVGRHFSKSYEIYHKQGKHTYQWCLYLSHLNCPGSQYKIILVLKKQKISLIFLGKIFLLKILVWKILVSKNYKTEEVVQSICKCSRIQQHLRNSN